MIEVLPLDAAGYRPHPLHAADREWRETSCSVDFFVEGLHALGCDPVPALAFTLGADFDGEQWRMLKIPPEDLRLLYGIAVDELNIWMPLTLHLCEHIGSGRMVTVDVDAWHLPDTAGVTYREVHQKTTIMAQMIDVSGRRLGYFHNAGYHELHGDDYEAIVGPPNGADGWELATMPPYTEAVRVDHLLRGSGSASALAHLAEPPVEAVVALAASHVARRPFSNPIARMEKRITDDLDWLACRELAVFHRYAFASLRQCGAGAELASSLIHWLAARGERDLEPVAEAMQTVSVVMKAAQFRLARSVARRAALPALGLEPAAEAWQISTDLLADRLGVAHASS